MAINLNQNNQLQPGQQPMVNNNNQVQHIANNQQRQRSTGFTNLQKVLNANQNNQLGNTIKQGVQGNVQNAQQQANQQSQNFYNQIGKANQDIQAGQQVKQNLSNIDFANQSDQSAQKIQDVNTQANQAALGNLRQGYQGPQGLNQADLLSRQAQELQQSGQGLLTQGGRQAALQQYVGRPGYTQGQQRLDTLLLGQNPNALREARRSAQTTAGDIQNQIRTAGQVGQATAQQYGTLGQQVGQGLTAATQGLGGALTARQQASINQAQNEIAPLKERLNKGQITAQDYTFLVNNVLNHSDNTYNLSPQQISALVNPNTDFTKSNVATQNELAARNALAQLAGRTNADEILDLDEAQVGMAKNPYIIDKAQQAQVAQQAEAAQNAIQGFNAGIGATNIGVFNTDNPFNVAGLNYQQIKELEPYFKESGNYDRGNVYDPTKYAAYQTLKNEAIRRGLANENVYKDAPSTVFGDTLANAMNQYYNTNKQFGIGKSLRDLLAQGEYVGKDGPGDASGNTVKALPIVK